MANTVDFFVKILIPRMCMVSRLRHVKLVLYFF